jgi:hypothetical protein
MNYTSLSLRQPLGKEVYTDLISIPEELLRNFREFSEFFRH